MKFIDYKGNSAYCYSNSLSMLLASIDEQIPPTLIEAIAGVGLGAFSHPDSNICFFSNFEGLPDQAISKCLRILGYRFKESASLDPEDLPLETIKEVVKDGPLLLGPLDMGFLKYDPYAEQSSGSDHYVLMYDIDDEKVYLHDPAGYPFVSLKIIDLKTAWRADSIQYKRGYYRYWCVPKRLKTPSSDEIYEKTLLNFKTTYREGEVSAKKMNVLYDEQAIIKMANNIREGLLTTREEEVLNSFVFPISARRALDLAKFLEIRSPNLSDTKYKQAKLFGECIVDISGDSRPELTKNVEELAKLEEKFKKELLR